jgi:hypothetical protein
MVDCGDYDGFDGGKMWRYRFCEMDMYTRLFVSSKLETRYFPSKL